MIVYPSQQRANLHESHHRLVGQYQIVVDPEKLRAFGIPLRQVMNAVQNANHDVGGSVLELAEAEYMVLTRGYLCSLEDIELIPVKTTPEGTPILLRDIARVQIGPEMRRVVADLDGEGEITGGIIVMRSGENALAMTVATIFAGLLPIMLQGGVGSEVMRPSAVPMVGGMVTAPLLSLFVLPAIYLLWRKPDVRV